MITRSNWLETLSQDNIVSPMTPQPPPTPNDRVPVWEQVIEDMKARDHVGRERYAAPLQAFNGRDALRDLYEELLDAAVYIKQAMIERDEERRAVESVLYHLVKNSTEGQTINNHLYYAMLANRLMDVGYMPKAIS